MKNSEKMTKVWPMQGLPCMDGSYNFGKDTNLQRKNEGYI